MAKTEITTVPYMDLGEGPHWDEPTKSFYFVDLFVGVINQFTPSTKTHIMKKISDQPVTFIIPVAKKPNQFVIGEDLCLKLIEWDRKSNTVNVLEVLTKIPEATQFNRTNDGKCDAKGRLWLGTMAKNEYLSTHPKNGAFYSFTRKEGLRKVLSDVGISNGLAWNKANTKMYYIDSFKYTIDEMDFELNSGKATNRRTIFSLPDNKMEGLPDGMTIDLDDKLWFASHKAGEIIQVDPKNGQKMRTIAPGAEQVTSLAFGGDDLSDLYVTSGKHGPPEETATLSKDSGAFFKISGLGAKGYPGVAFDDSI